MGNLMYVEKISQSNLDQISETIFNEKALNYILSIKGEIVWNKIEDTINIDSGSFVFHGMRKHAFISSLVTYRLKIDFNFYELNDIVTYENATVNLSYNPFTGSQNFKKAVEWKFDNNELIVSQLADFLKNKIGISIKELPHEIILRRKKEAEGLFKKTVRLTRRKLPSRGLDAKALYISSKPNQPIGHEIFYQIMELETRKVEEPVLINNKNPDGTEINKDQAIKIMNDFIEHAKTQRYVDENSIEYIPEDANPKNWNFNDNYWKEGKLPFDEKNQTETTESIDTEHIEELLSSSNKITKISQGFGGYFTGNVPEYATQFLGTSMVDASQISSMFGKANEAVNLVNRFDSSLLWNISFIFNFAQSGAYGVYLSELDRAIKIKALAKKLEQQGYEIKETGQGLTAFPKTSFPKTTEQIQQDIDKLYADLQSKGGTAIGINMNSILNASRQDAIEMESRNLEMFGL